MNDRELDQALGSLDPVTASEGFTESVLARLDAADTRDAREVHDTAARRNLRLPPWPLAVAASLLLVVAAAFATQTVLEHRHQERMAKIQQLRTEHQQLSDALAQLRSRRDARPPDAVLLMDREGDGLIVPFEPAAEGRGLRPAPNRLVPVEVRPASYRTY